jgi:putative cardiolipin synthase
MKKTLTIFVVVTAYFLLATSVLSAKVYEYTYDNQITLLQDVRESIALKLSMVKNAKHHIHIMTYYLDDNKFPMELMKELNLAHARGVDVRIITTFLPSFTMDFFGKAKKALFKDFNKKSKAVLAYMSMLPGTRLAITNNIHEKIFLVDGETAILGGRNLSDSIYNAKDLEIILKGPVVNQVQKHFERMFTFMAMLKIEDKCLSFDQRCRDKINRTKFSETDSGFYFEQPRFENGAKARIISNETLISQHKNEFWGDERFTIKDDIVEALMGINFRKLRAYNYFIMPSERYKQYLVNKLAEGKKIEMITNSRITAESISANGYYYSLPEMYELMKKGLAIYQWQGLKTPDEQDRLSYLHEKVMLFDDDRAMIGSHNFNAGSTSVGNEIILDFYSKPIVKTLGDIFEAEKINPLKTYHATLPFVLNEMNINKKKIGFFRRYFIRNLVKQAY